MSRFSHPPSEHGTSPSVASFKFRLNRELRKPPKYFNTGTRQGQILHARLRMEYSSLNAHLHKKNIEPSSSCSCGSYESTYHSFLNVLTSHKLGTDTSQTTLMILIQTTYYMVNQTYQKQKMKPFFQKIKILY